MKMKDLKKLAKKADEIKRKSKEKEKRIRLLLKSAEAGLIKKPKCRWWQLNMIKHCPKCGGKLIIDRESIGYADILYYYCRNQDYEYAKYAHKKSSGESFAADLMP